MKTVLIVGSSRNDGDTMKLANFIVENSNCNSMNLNDYEISYFDYNHHNREDDYLKLMSTLLANYETFVFVTPVYWYSMSGIMKVFFDRLTDLLTIEKDLGRLLRNKNMAVLSCSVGNHLGDHFWIPFQETAKYLGMKYLGNVHTISGEVDQSEVLKFIQTISE